MAPSENEVDTPVLDSIPSVANLLELIRPVITKFLAHCIKGSLAKSHFIDSKTQISVDAFIKWSNSEKVKQISKKTQR